MKTTFVIFFFFLIAMAAEKKSLEKYENISEINNTRCIQDSTDLQFTLMLDSIHQLQNNTKRLKTQIVKIKKKEKELRDNSCVTEK